MVERLVANQTAGVRFPLLAHKTQGPDALALGPLCFTAIRESKDGGGIQDERSDCLSPSRGRAKF